MATIGDISQDNLTDVAVGAPLEGLEAVDGTSFGSVYIYNGRQDGLSTSPSQVTCRALFSLCSGILTSPRCHGLSPNLAPVLSVRHVPGGQRCPMRHRGLSEGPGQGLAPGPSSGVRGYGNICLFPDLYLPFLTFLTMDLPQILLPLLLSLLWLLSPTQLLHALTLISQDSITSLSCYIFYGYFYLLQPTVSLLTSVLYV